MKKQNRIATFKDYVGELKVNYRRTEKPTKKITSSFAAAEFMRAYFNDIIDNHEEVKILHLNRANQVVNVHQVTSGSETASIVPVKDILRNALLIKVHAIILFHNHPSGNLKPSTADISISKKLREASSLMDIQVLDSIILTREGYYSLSDNSDF
jgi:DNA repair protein RadC